MRLALSSQLAQLSQLTLSFVACRLVEDYPSVLDVSAFERTLEEARRVLGPKTDVQHLISTQPGVVFSLQRGSDLVPYDPPDNSDG